MEEENHPKYVYGSISAQAATPPIRWGDFFAWTLYSMIGGCRSHGIACPCEEARQNCYLLSGVPSVRHLGQIATMVTWMVNVSGPLLNQWSVVIFSKTFQIFIPLDCPLAPLQFL